MRRVGLKIFLILSAATAFSGSAHANLITNGDFEAGNLASWTASGNISVGNEQPTIQNGGLYSAFLNAGETAPNAVLSQSFATTIGANYVVSFLYGGNNASQSITASVFDASGLTLVSNLDTSGPNMAGGVDALTTYTFNFIADSTTSTLTFADYTGNSTASNDGVLDNINANAVPEPASIAVLVSGFAGLMMSRRRRAAR